jgi:hypothetical protein
VLRPTIKERSAGSLIVPEPRYEGVEKTPQGFHELRAGNEIGTFLRVGAEVVDFFPTVLPTNVFVIRRADSRSLLGEEHVLCPGDSGRGIGAGKQRYGASAV